MRLLRGTMLILFGIRISFPVLFLSTMSLPADWHCYDYMMAMDLTLTPKRLYN